MKNSSNVKAHAQKLTLAVLAVGAAAFAGCAAPAVSDESVDTVGAALSQEITIGLDWKAPSCTGTVTISGLGTGTMACQDFKPRAAKWDLPARAQTPFEFRYTATDKYCFDAGCFLITFQAECTVVAAEPWPGAQTQHCQGQWRIHSGTGSLVNAKGTGSFFEVQNISDPVNFVGVGRLDGSGKLSY
jgi:hypothetical protein